MKTGTIGRVLAGIAILALIIWAIWATEAAAVVLALSGALVVVYAWLLVALARDRRRRG